MSALNWRAIESAHLVRAPFDHMAIAQALEPDAIAAITADFPAIRDSGSFALADAPPGPAVRELIAELESPRFRRQMARIFGIDLEGRPAVVTLRGQCASRDGRVHIDSKSKLISLLLYLNEGWADPDGQLRLLDGPEDLEAPAVEIPATIGSLVAFQRSDHSWHGHTSFAGQRRVVQLNYLRSERDSLVGNLRRRLSALTKRRGDRPSTITASTSARRCCSNRS